MVRKSVGHVNGFGKELLEATGKNFVFEPKFITPFGIIVTWSAYLVEEEAPLLGAEAYYGCGKYNGD